MRVFPDMAEIDPTLFVVNWDTIFELLALIIILSFIVERMLALLFESPIYVKFHRNQKENGVGSFKSPIAFIVSAAICVIWQVDAIAVLMKHSHVSVLGGLVSGALVAGGSKASIKLFHDILNVKSGAYSEYQKTRSKLKKNSTVKQSEGAAS